MSERGIFVSIIIGMFMYASGYGWGKHTCDMYYAEQIKQLKQSAHGWHQIALSKDCDIRGGKFTAEGACVKDGEFIFYPEVQP
jgi:hypothetical protein